MGIHHRIIRVLKAPLIAVGIVKKPKVKPAITVPKASNRLTPAQIWEDKTFAAHEPKPTPPPSRLILSETDEVAIPYVQYDPKPLVTRTEGGRRSIKSKAKKSKSLPRKGVMREAKLSEATKRKVAKPVSRAKAKVKTKPRQHHDLD